MTNFPYTGSGEKGWVCFGSPEGATGRNLTLKPIILDIYPRSRCILVSATSLCSVGCFAVVKPD